MPNNDPYAGLDDAVGAVAHQQTQNTAAQIRNNVVSAVGSNPDQESKFKHLAAFVGVPVDSARADPDAIEQQATVMQMDAGKLAQDHPHTAQFMLDPQNVKIMRDDVPATAAVEQAVAGIPAPAQDQTPGKSIGQSLLDTPGAMARGLGGAFSKSAGAFNLALGAFPTMYDKAASLMTGTPTTAASDAWFKTMVDPRMNAAPAYELDKNAGVPEKAGHMASSLLAMWSQITLTGGGGEAGAAADTVAGVIKGAVEHGMKSMAFPALTDAVDTGQRVYAQTGDGAAAARAAQAQYLTTSAAGVVPLSAPGGIATRLAGGFVSGGVLSEASRQMMNKALPASMQQPFSTEDLIMGGLSGAMLGGVMGPRAEPSFHEALKQTYIDASRADTAQKSGDMIAALGQAATASKLRERDPEGFRQFVQNVTEDGHLQDLYVDAREVQNALAQGGVNHAALAERLPDLASQMHEALQSNGDVVIPVADYVTHIAGGPLDAALLPHLKAEPDGMTYKEGQQYFQDQASGMKDQAAKIAADQQTQDAAQADAQGVHDKVLDQLNATGRFRPEVNKAYAGLTRDFYSTMADRAGMTPSELYAKYPLKITSDSLASGEKMFGQGWDSIDTGEPTSPPAYNPRGTFTPETNTIRLFKGADLSTYLHESGHFFLEALHGMASGEGAPEGIRSDFDTLLTSFGEKGATPEQRMADWSAKSLDEKRDGHEQFARSFEKYLMEGKAPSLELQGLFSRFRSWLVNVYRNFTELPNSVSPEVRGVMDRLLASDEAIKQAEQVRGYAPLFKTAAEAGMTEEQFKAYTTLGSEATAAAVGDMQTRSMRDMKWLSNAKDRAMKALQKTAAVERAKIRDEVTKEVMAEPVNRARELLKTGKEVDAAGHEVPDTRPLGAPKVKLDAAALKEMYPEGALGAPDLAKLRGLTGKDGVHPDMIAERFGMNSGHELVRQLTEGENAKDKIAGLTDQRMLEQHGELIDSASIERAADSAVHNEGRARFMATGLKILTKSPIPARQIERAARDAAEAAVAAKKVSDLRPAMHAAAEARANKEALKLAPKDPAGAAGAQRAALLNNRLFRASQDAVAEVKKAVDFLKRFDKTSVRGKIDIDIRDQIDDLLSRFDLRQKVPEGPTRAQVNLQTWIESQRAAGYQPVFTADMINPEFRTHFLDMTVEQVRGLRDTVAALEHIGRERRTILIDGVRTDVDELIKNEMIPKMQERGEQFSDAELVDRPEDRHTNPIAIRLDKFRSQMRAIAAQLKPQEFKRNQYDNHDLLGPFGRAIFDRVFNANYHKVDMLKAMSKDYQAKVDELGKDWQKSLNDQVDNTRLVDPDKSVEGAPPAMMRITRGRMIGIAIHVGNESNFDKITKGWGWKPEDVWSFLHDNMTENDWKATQSVWDQYEKHFPDMQAMARRLGNTSPDKIEPRPFATKFGEMAGGYAAIKYDSLRSRRGEKEAAGLAINPADNLFNRDYFRPDTTTNGSMNARMDGYTDRVDLDFHHIARSISDSIHDLAYREALIDSNKIIENVEFRRQFKRTYGPEAYGSLRDWIGQIANSENFDRQSGALGSFLAYTRTGIVMTGISLRVSTVLKHGGSAGIKTTGYFLGGGEKFLASRFASMGTDYKNQIAGAQEKFGEIRARLMQQDRDFRVTSTALFEADPLISKAERFGHAAVAWSDMMTAVPTAWAAYDRAITEGIPKNQGGTGAPVTEAQAVAYANKIVREAHGSNIETARSMVLNTNSEALKMFTTLYGFMNTTYGQALDGWDKLHTAGISNPAVFARSFMALIVPAIWAGYLTHGGPKDGDNWAAWVGKSIATEVAGMVPFARDAASMVEGYSHAGQVGVESWLNTIVRAGMDVKNMVQGKEVKAPIKDISNAVGVGLHIPGLGQLGTTAQYLADVHQGKQHPQGAADVAKGVAFGPPAKH